MSSGAINESPKSVKHARGLRSVMRTLALAVKRLMTHVCPITNEKLTRTTRGSSCMFSKEWTVNLLTLGLRATLGPPTVLKAFRDTVRLSTRRAISHKCVHVSRNSTHQMQAIICSVTKRRHNVLVAEPLPDFQLPAPSLSRVSVITSMKPG